MFLACFDMQLESLVERIELQDSDRNIGMLLMRKDLRNILCSQHDFIGVYVNTI